MRLEGRRESENVEDRRGMGTGTKIGIGGIGGLILAGLLYFLTGDPSAFQQVGGMGAQSEDGQIEYTQEEQELAKFSRQVIASTEDIWQALSLPPFWHSRQCVCQTPCHTRHT